MSVENGLDYALPSEEAMRVKLAEGLTEMKNSIVRAAAESSYVTETSDLLSKEFGIPAKVLRDLAKDLAKDTFRATNVKHEAFAELRIAARTILFKEKAEDL